MKKVVQTRRRRVQQCEKLLLLGAHREIPGSSSQLRVFFDSLIFCLSLVRSNDGSSLALWVFDLIGLLRIGLLIIALVIVGRGKLNLGFDISFGTLGVGC